jgi:hypothetical protein
VAEESHLDEMRSAIRGDFARLAERRGDQTLLRLVEEPEVPADEPPLESTDDTEMVKRRSWLARLVSP